MTTAQIELEELSVGADYEKVANRFRPIFEKIAQGAIQREKERILPFEPIQWLKEAKWALYEYPVNMVEMGFHYLNCSSFWQS